MYALVLINLWHVLGLFLGNLVMYLLRSHAIVVAKSCEGGCKMASGGLVRFLMWRSHSYLSRFKGIVDIYVQVW